MSGSSSLSAAARLHVVKPDPGSSHVIDVESHPQPQGSGGNARPQAKGKGKGKAQAKDKAKAKGKGKGKGKGKAKGNPVRDGSPVTPAPARELAGSRHGTDHWDDLGRAWAGYLSQSKKGGQNQGTQQPHHHHHHRDGQPTPSGSGQRRWGRDAGRGGGGGGGDGPAHAGQKRKAMAANGTAGDGNERTAKRRKKASRPSGRDAGWVEDEGATQQHPDFWHPDGSVIVEVGKARFRLHQSILQKHSTYFADAFREQGGHQRGGGRGPKGGHLPVHRVAETTAEDFASLLTAIEEPMKYGDGAPPMPILVGVLRAARALSFDAQRKWAERMLERTWPATLDALTVSLTPHAEVAFAFAHACGLRGVQKRASYELLRTPTFGQNIVADAHAGELPRAELLRLLHAREQLGLAWSEVAGKAPTDFTCPLSRHTKSEHAGAASGSISSSGGGGGSGSGSCASANVDRVHARWAELVHSSGLYVQWMVDPLMGLQDLVEISWKEEGFCKKCVAARRSAWNQLRRKLWNDLDVWLGLNVEKVE